MILDTMLNKIILLSLATLIMMNHMYMKIQIITITIKLETKKFYYNKSLIKKDWSLANGLKKLCSSHSSLEISILQKIYNSFLVFAIIITIVGILV